MAFHVWKKALGCTTFQPHWKAFFNPKASLLAQKNDALRLTDIDFDWDGGRPLVKALFPKTDFGFGRKSRPVSHIFYTIDRPLITRKFEDIDNDTLVEIRGTKNDGTLGFQTMVPPSIHPSEETVELRSDGDIAHVVGDDLERTVALYAAGCLLLKHLGPRGLLHDRRLEAAGFLLSSGLTEDEAITVLTSAARASGNDDRDARSAVLSTAAQIDRGGKIKGSGVLAKAIGANGHKVIARIREWLGVDDFTRNDKGAILTNSQGNIRLALSKLGIVVEFDRFSERIFFETPTTSRRLWTEEALIKTRFQIDMEFRFLPAKEFLNDVVKSAAWDNSRHPVREYLASLTWDATPRLDTWLTTYGSATDTPYTRAVGALVLTAAVRRVRRPGSKFDELLVLESSQGTLKSSALRALCPDETWFSDDLPLGVRSKEVIEAAEMVGGRDVDKLKAFLSRQVDGPVRMAYERVAAEVTRQFIVIGTTNKVRYLKDLTGARRFWPVTIERFDVEGLTRDGDQLWAEAAHHEAQGESIRLDPTLYDDAGREQESRRVSDPWETEIDRVLEDATAKPDRACIVPVSVIWSVLGSARYHDNQSSERVDGLMKRRGFEKRKLRLPSGANQKPSEENPKWCWVRGDPKSEDVLVINLSDCWESEM